MAPDQLTLTDYLVFIDEAQGNKLLAAVALGDAVIPRVGEHVTLHFDDRTSGAIYEVKGIKYDFGRRWKSDDPSLLRVTVTVKR